MKTKVIESKFDKNNIVYEVTSDDDGGVKVIYQQVKSKAILFTEGREFVDGDEVNVKIQFPAINTDKMENHVYRAEANFCSLEDLAETVMATVNKRKLY